MTTSIEIINQRTFAVIENNPYHMTTEIQPKMSLAVAAQFLGLSSQAVHKQLKVKGLVCPKIGNKGYITHPIAKELFQLVFKKKKICVHMVKGGIGKTTTVVSIVCAASTYGAKTLVVDIDPQGNSTDAFNVDADLYPVLIDIIKDKRDIKEAIAPVTAGIDLICSRIDNVMLDNEIIAKHLPLDKLLNKILEPIINNYDIIVIDCPPTMGHMVSAANLFSDIILAPLTPDKFSTKGLSILKEEVENLRRHYDKNINYRVFINKFSEKTLLSNKVFTELMNDPDLSEKALGTVIKFTQDIPNITEQGDNLFSSIKKSPPREDFDMLAREIFEIIPANEQKARKEQEVENSKEVAVNA